MVARKTDRKKKTRIFRKFQLAQDFPRTPTQGGRESKGHWTEPSVKVEWFSTFLIL